MIAEDREYIDRVLSGDAKAFEGLVRKYSRMAGAIAYAIAGDFSAAEDIVQDAFLKAFCSLKNLRDQDRFKVWLAGIVRSRAIDWLRQRRGARVVPFAQAFGGRSERAGSEEEDAEAARVCDPSPPMDELFDKRELRQKILGALRSLSEEDRVVVSLKYMDGLSYREIAELTGATESAVESRLFRARQALRKKLDRILK